jgi:hypothetical protein
MKCALHSAGCLNSESEKELLPYLLPMTHLSRILIAGMNEMARATYEGCMSIDVRRWLRDRARPTAWIGAAIVAGLCETIGCSPRRSRKRNSLYSTPSKGQ